MSQHTPLAGLAPAHPTEDHSAEGLGDNFAPTSSGFAARLREETKLVHREAERTGFIAELIRGRAPRGGYARFLRNLVPVYAALETALGHWHAGALSDAFAWPSLYRLANLEHDIKAVLGGDGQRDAPLPEALAYASSIAASAEGDGVLLVAHAYARYLGDLSGGQILKPILARSLGLSPNMLTFYDFPQIADPASAKAQMRAALDTIATPSLQADRIVEEAIAAFRHNIELSNAVAATLEAEA